MPGEIAMRTRLGLIAVLVHLPWSRKEDKFNFGVSTPLAPGQYWFGLNRGS